MPLTPDQKRYLLGLARRRLENALALSSEPWPDRFGGELDAARGAFVTIHLRGRLRGCIGSIVATRPLREVVADLAPKSAFEDPRFAPLAVEELDEAILEISALTPLRPIRRWQEFLPGLHGLVMYKGGHTAVFLPQVATEQGWDAPTTLSHLSQKAGLDPDAWREGAEFSVFEAEVFSEDGRGGVREAGKPPAML